MQALYSRELNEDSEENLLDFPWYEYDGSDRDDRLSFPRFILAAVLRDQQVLDDEIKKQLEHWDFERLNKVDQAIMRLGCYELMFTNDTPPQIIINEALEISKELGSGESYRIINGVLDSVSKAHR